ncbi:hypothetical protein D0Y65_043366 [Glycine soja]|uniref:Uncharacterized protein n=1 Tax=Glycine soja TaxID=3848 RepID=A0A445GH60_GLYSO|nr:hypothetical protein D0Y65_043366 [Glycine soja]
MPSEMESNNAEYVALGGEGSAPKLENIHKYSAGTPEVAFVATSNSSRINVFRWSIGENNCIASNVSSRS